LDLPMLGKVRNATSAKARRVLARLVQKLDPRRYAASR
jgi:hypothetical protein